MFEGRQRSVRVASWNVNGLRACARKGFPDWLAKSRAQIVGVQEVRATPEQIPDVFGGPKRWHAHYVTAERKGYSGVGLLSRVAPISIESSVGRPRFDREGRVIIGRFGKVTVVSAYFPNGNGKGRDNSRVPYKLAFYRRLFRLLWPEVQRGGRVLVMGDFNTAHEEIDLARPQQNRETSGFLPEERRELSRWIDAGFIDTFRHFETDGGHYTWWSQRAGVRERNVGWRIDYILASPGLKPFLRGARIHSEVRGSDHCPVSVEICPKAFAPRG